VLRRARAAGLETNLELASVDPARLAGLVRPCLPHLDLLVVNDVEIGAIAGEATSRDGSTDVEACVRAASMVMAEGAMRLVVVHFPTGAVALARGGEPVRRPSVQVPREAIAGANGAGDAFAAGLLYGLPRGLEPRRRPVARPRHGRGLAAGDHDHRLGRVLAGVPRTRPKLGLARDVLRRGGRAQGDAPAGVAAQDG
jgi:sugar/nucleoside kinase (ribokinase family)